jgi:hypothetical protein
VIIDKELQLDVHPKWDVYANDQFSLRSRYSTIFLKAANIVLTRIRANNRLQKLKAAIEKVTTNHNSPNPQKLTNPQHIPKMNKKINKKCIKNA